MKELIVITAKENVGVSVQEVIDQGYAQITIVIDVHGNYVVRAL